MSVEYKWSGLFGSESLVKCEHTVVMWSKACSRLKHCLMLLFILFCFFPHLINISCLCVCSSRPTSRNFQGSSFSHDTEYPLITLFFMEGLVQLFKNIFLLFNRHTSNISRVYPVHNYYCAKPLVNKLFDATSLCLQSFNSPGLYWSLSVEANISVCISLMPTPHITVRS